MLDDPKLLPFLPAIYVAWADGNLTPAEVGEICSRVSAATAPELDCEALLGPWLNPEKPPTAEQLHRLLTTIREASEDVSPDERSSLTSLGLAMARLEGREESPVIQRALEELEAALAVPGEEATRAILVPRRPPAVVRAEEPGFDPRAMAELSNGRIAIY